MGVAWKKAGWQSLISPPKAHRLVQHNIVFLTGMSSMGTSKAINFTRTFLNRRFFNSAFTRRFKINSHIIDVFAKIQRIIENFVRHKHMTGTKTEIPKQGSRTFYRMLSENILEVFFMCLIARSWASLISPPLLSSSSSTKMLSRPPQLWKNVFHIKK